MPLYTGSLLRDHRSTECGMCLPGGWRGRRRVGTRPPNSRTSGPCCRGRPPRCRGAGSRRRRRPGPRRRLRGPRHAGVASCAAALDSGDRYLQYGLNDRRDPREHPLVVALRAAEGDDGAVGGDAAALEALRRRFSDFAAVMDRQTRGRCLTLTDAPVWVNGNFTAISTTHNDDYVNFIMVLQGVKTFYVAPPDAIQPSARGRAHEAADVIPSNVAAGQTPQDWSDRRRRATYDQLSTPMRRFTVEPGQLLQLPRGWWHYVSSAPQTVMVNFWYAPQQE